MSENMDRIIEKKRWSKKRIITLGGVGLFAGFVIFVIANSWGSSRLNVDAERMLVGKVERANFREYIPVTGVVQPLTTIYLDLLEGGRVEEIFVEDGAMMTHGQPILRLSNTDLELSLVNQETNVYNLLMQMQIAQNNARQNTILQMNQTVDAESLLIDAERRFDADKKLYASGIISTETYNESENRYSYLKEKRRLAQEVMKQDSIASAQQMAQIRQSYQGAQNALDLMRRKVADLTVRAPIDGQLTALDAEIGQRKNNGERIGQMDVLSGFKVRVDIDEH